MALATPAHVRSSNGTAASIASKPGFDTDDTSHFFRVPKDVVGSFLDIWRKPLVFPSVSVSRGSWGGGRIGSWRSGWCLTLYSRVRAIGSVRPQRKQNGRRHFQVKETFLAPPLPKIFSERTKP